MSSTILCYRNSTRITITNYTFFMILILSAIFMHINFSKGSISDPLPTFPMFLYVHATPIVNCFGNSYKRIYRRGKYPNCFSGLAVSLFQTNILTIDLSLLK